MKCIHDFMYICKTKLLILEISVISCFTCIYMYIIRLTAGARARHAHARWRATEVWLAGLNLSRDNILRVRTRNILCLNLPVRARRIVCSATCNAALSPNADIYTTTCKVGLCGLLTLASPTLRLQLTFSRRQRVGRLTSCAILFMLPRFSVTSACNPSHHYRHVMTEEGRHPILYPVNDYSSCCPAAEQRISHVQVTNVTICTGGSQWVPEFTFGSSSVSASMKDNQIVLNVRSVCWVYSLLECAAMLHMYFICIVASRVFSKGKG